jgi:hypothetical protein
MMMPTCGGIADGQDPTDFCPGALTCNGMGACHFANGAACTTAAQCESDLCECADATCTGGGRCAAMVCPACNFINATGTACTGLIANNQDPKNGCAGALLCDGAGACKLNAGELCTSDNRCQTGFCECGDAACTSAGRRCGFQDCTGVLGCRALGGTFNCDGPAMPKNTDPNNACTLDCSGLGNCEVGTGASCSLGQEAVCDSNSCACSNASCTTRVCSVVSCSSSCQFTTNGTSCTNIAYDTDPRNACSQNCNGNGSCQSCGCFDPGVGTICQVNFNDCGGGTAFCPSHQTCALECQCN